MSHAGERELETFLGFVNWGGITIEYNKTSKNLYFKEVS